MADENPEIRRSITPDIDQITTAYNEVLDHNRSNTGFGALFKAILREPEDGSPGNQSNTTDPEVEQDTIHSNMSRNLQQGVVEGDMKADLQDIFHGDTFLRIGIKIAPIGSFVRTSEGVAVTSTELLPVIQNTSLFTEFLSGLSAEDVQNEATETILCDIIASLCKKTGFCLSDENQEGLNDDEKARLTEAGEDALRSFVAIEPEYERLGLDGPVMRRRVEGVSKELAEFLNLKHGGGLVPDKLGSEYREFKKNSAKMATYEAMEGRVRYWARNLLPEYITAQKWQYLTPPNEQGFGPAQWQMDGGQSRWKKAFDFVKRLERGERTKEFAQEVKRGLITSLDAALEQLQDTDKDIYWRSQGNDLENIRRALSGQAYDEKQFAEYTKEPDYNS
jgi:hypothetical protein